MGIMVYSLLWVMQDFVHQPYGVVKEEDGDQQNRKRRGNGRINECSWR